jgi:hypothetical protein
MVAAYRRGTFGTGVVRGNGLAIQKSGVVSSGTAVTVTDSNFANNVLLTKTTGVNTATNNTFLDSSANNFTITRSGTPTQGSFTPYWPSGYWSGYFGTTTADNLLVSNNAVFAVGTSNFTVEFWANWTAWSGTNQRMILMGQSGLSPIEISRDSNADVLNIFTNGGSSKIAYTWTPTLGAWYHIAVVRSGTSTNQLTLYINGTSVATGTSADSISANNFFIGGLNWASGYNMQGYLSNVRFVNGTAIVPPAGGPTTPLTAVTNTVLLTCQDNRFKDNSTNAFAITVNNSPKIQSFQPFALLSSYTAAAYGGSVYFGTSGDSVVPPQNSVFNLSTGNWTIEAWFYAQSLGSSSARYITMTPAAGTVYGLIPGGSANAFVINTFGSSNVLTSSVTPTLYAWQHIAIVKNSSTTSVYLNGVSIMSGTVSWVNANTTIFFGGNTGSFAYDYFGYISNPRVVMGTAVYTANFTPPTAPVTAISGTQLLLNYTNAGIYDAAVQNNEITVGSAQVSTSVYKWSPASMKFNGTSDYLSIPHNPQLNLTTGDFTIETWFYCTALTAANQVILGKDGISGTSYSQYWIGVTTAGKLIAPLGNGNGLSPTETDYGAATSVTLNVWNHVALVRTGTTIKVFLNGTQVNSTAQVTAMSDGGKPLLIGWRQGDTVYFNGYVQDVRITKGIARYTANFTAPTAEFLAGPVITYTPTVPDAPIMGYVSTVTNDYTAKIGYMAPLLNGGSTITSYTAVSTPGGITGTSVTSRSGTITVSGLQASNTYTFTVYATNAIGTSTYSAVSKSITTPAAQLGRTFILSDMDLALTDLVLLNTSLSTNIGTTKAKSYALATIYGSD